MRSIYQYWFQLFMCRRPELFYFGTNQSGNAKKDLSDLYPFTSDNTTAFGCRKIVRLKIALRQAEEKSHLE